MLGFKNIFIAETNENISIFYPTYDHPDNKPDYLTFPKE